MKDNCSSRENELRLDTEDMKTSEEESTAILKGSKEEVGEKQMDLRAINPNI